MNSGKSKDPVTDMCLAGATVAFWSIMQEVAGSGPFTVMTNISVRENSIVPIAQKHPINLSQLNTEFFLLFSKVKWY